MSDLEQQNKSSPVPIEFGFEDSKMGTKEYWDHFYDSELANFEDTGDEGEIWFGVSTELRILKFIVERIPLSARICDLGSGNGALLRKLRDRGYSNLLGLDYSQKAVELARRASSPSHCNERGRGGTREASGKIALPIQFRVVDLTLDKLDDDLHQKFDILVDKGTLDAISLASGRQKLLANYHRNICQLFRSPDEIDDDFELLGTKDSAVVRMRRLQKRLLLIISCNFTKDELVDLLETDDGLRFCAELPNPLGTGTIQFGGEIGSTATGAIFQWKKTDEDSTQ